NRVNEAARGARAGNEVEPAPRGVTTFEAGQSLRDGIRPVKVVQQPAVEAIDAEGVLNCGNGNHISPFQSSGSGTAVRKTSRCHLPPPQGSMTSAAMTSTRISANVRCSGSFSRW